MTWSVCGCEKHSNRYKVISTYRRGFINDHGLCSIFLAKHNVSQVQQPLYFPDLTPCHFFLFKNQISLKGTQISKCQGSPRECDEAATCYVKKVVPEMLPSMETRLDNVCGFRRKLFQRRLNANMCCSFLFIAPVPILFNQTSY